MSAEMVHKVGVVARDKAVLRLIGKFLPAGVMPDGVTVISTEGTPQGSPEDPELQSVPRHRYGRAFVLRNIRNCGAWGNGKVQPCTPPRPAAMTAA